MRRALAAAFVTAVGLGALPGAHAGDVPGRWTFVGSGGAPGSVELQNLGAGDFDPGRLATWHYDVRRPLIEAGRGGSYRNIYAASVVRTDAGWNVFFGGWDGTKEGYDRVSLTRTQDFLSFDQHQLVIDHGALRHANNPSVIRLPDGRWYAAYTTLAMERDSPAYSPWPYNNKPGFATSSDGETWTPSEASADDRIAMSGYQNALLPYPNWEAADVNGGNVVYYENGVYHLYFDDLNPLNDPVTAVFHATSKNGIAYRYAGKALDEPCRIANDLRAFEVAGRKLYLMAAHCNTGAVYASISDGLDSFPRSWVLFGPRDGSDAYIVSVGLVTDGNRLLGALYGATDRSDLTANSIHGIWLQKRVVFETDKGTYEIEGARGPETVVLSIPGDGAMTGRFAVYDSDGVTLLSRSEELTIHSGEVWRYES